MDDDVWSGWPIPNWWPTGKCACPVCQAAEGVVHTCGKTRIFDTCQCVRRFEPVIRECEG